MNREHAYATFEYDQIKAVEEEGRKNTAEEGIDDDSKDRLTFQDAVFVVDEVSFSDGKFSFSGNVQVKGVDLAWLSTTIPLANESESEVLAYFVKKFNRIKTALEALK